jgi:cytochrome c peroxidase
MRVAFAIGILASLLAGCGSHSSAPALPAEPPAPTRLEALGRKIFFDITLSNPRGQSCAGCHLPATGFAGNFGGEDGVPLAADGRTLGLRNTPSAAYASFSPAFSIEPGEGGPVARGGQFLDGRAASLEEQAAMPFFAAGEMNVVDAAQLASRLAASPYAALLLEEFGPDVFTATGLIVERATRAIAAFERTAELAPFSSRLDQVLAGVGALTLQEREGMALFLDPAAGNCAACHAFDPQSPLASDRVFTRFGYSVLAAPRNPRIPANADAAFNDLGLCGPRRERVADDRLCGAFKVPTLRNVALRTHYMHNGAFTALRDAVAFHVTRDTEPARWYPGGIAYDDLPAAYRANVDRTPIRLDDRGIDSVVAFLRTLDDGAGPSRAP